MKKTIITILVSFALIVLLQDIIQHKKRSKPVAARPYVVMLSMDGFRWDYQDKAPTPTLDSITKYGVKATGLQPSFPSKTFPNHYTIATGLYPGNHGLISNSFYAPDLKKYYSIGDRSKVENGDFYGGEPIWVTAESQRLKTGSYFWVGSEAPIKGYQPTYWKKYEHTFPYYQRVDSIISWLSKPYNERPKLVTWYLDETDGTGHKFGPDSPEIVQSVAHLDNVIAYFFNKVKTLEIKDSLNFIVVSDHGMQAIDTNDVVYLDQYIKPQWLDTLLGSNPFLLLYPKKHYADSIVKNLSQVQGIHAWAKKDIPERFHLKQSIRIPEVIVVADSSWGVYLHKHNKVPSGGTHGFDNTISDMNGIFYAIGPNFKQGFNAGQLYNTDIYNLIAHILKLKPAPNDGKPERIFKVLR